MTEEEKDNEPAVTDGLNGLVAAIEAADGVGAARATELDREFKSRLAALFRGMSPIEIATAYFDWLSHLAISPGKQLQLLQSLLKKASLLGLHGVAALAGNGRDGPAKRLERRVSGPEWQNWPFSLFAQAHELGREFFDEATADVAGLSPAHRKLVRFLNQQVIDALSPANFPLTNPLVLQATREESGRNLGRGLKNAAKDALALLGNGSREPSPGFEVGEDLGITPGKVVFRNDLFELIQYSPATDKVGAEPVLFCPAWIMKYYILDLSPKNSLVRYLVEQGKTVFMMSWKNPGADDADVGFEDYVHDGVMTALDAVTAICPRRKVHAVGYCIGGTLLCVAAAAMARDGDERLKSVSLFAAQADFTEAGGITAFISDSQLEFLDNVMWKEGVLSSDKMGGAFGALHASDLIFGSGVNRYLLGKPDHQIDLMAWNADGTRMPYRMHTEYLHKLFLRNELATNKFAVGGRPVSLGDITVPLFVLGTETDHVAPWQSVFKLRSLTNTELTFLLTSGGHNAGVISGPEHPRRRYRMQRRQPGDRYVDPDTWLADNEPVPGSWWPAWNDWLDEHSGAERDPPGYGAAKKGYEVLGDAPGTYVFG
ncbi:MAG: alpha/beta fold hydrolase [Pseudomonadota bacterium]